MFNAELDDIVKQHRWDLDKRKFEHAQECISEVTDKLKNRNRLVSLHYPSNSSTGVSNIWKASLGNRLPPSFQRQDYSFRGFRAQPTKGPFLGASFACGSFSHSRKNCPHIAWEQPSTTAKSELDLEDKYNIASFDNDMILTNDYYEYEQGQKDNIVKGRLKNNIHFWKTVLKASSFVIDTIDKGYKIPFILKLLVSFSPNN